MSGYNPCGACNGAQGTETTTQGENGATIRTWTPCGACNGSGLSQ